MSVRQIPYRQAEDLIAHYAPARYLCNLMDSRWNPDHITIFEFTQMMGAEGMDIFNKTFLSNAGELGILDPTKLMSNTTAQEAMIPYPNEVGLMKRFSDLTVGALKKVSGKFLGLKERAKEIANKVKGLVRRSRFEGWHRMEFSKRTQVKNRTLETNFGQSDLCRRCRLTFLKRATRNLSQRQWNLRRVFQDQSGALAKMFPTEIEWRAVLTKTGSLAQSPS